MSGIDAAKAATALAGGDLRIDSCSGGLTDDSQIRRRNRVRQGSHALKERGNDLYQTPSEAVAALLAVEKLPSHVWEPASGPGSIVRVLRSAGRTVLATDLIDYSSPDQDAGGRDFLLEREIPVGVEAIVTNPPFKLATEFVAHAIELAPIVAMLLRLTFLESEKRSPILDGGLLARVHVFRNRLPMMHRDGWTGPRARSAIAYAWFVWDRAHTGGTQVDRISWVRP